MLKAYFDESGIHEDAKACIVAGYWGKKGPCRQLESGWRATLRRFEVPLEEFHAEDVLDKAGFFFGWDFERQKQFLAALGDVVMSVVLLRNRRRLQDTSFRTAKLLNSMMREIPGFPGT
jgi:hypothetical protein